MASNPQKPEKKNHTGKVLKGSPRGTEERVCALKELRRKSEVEFKPGEFVQGQGVYIGTWSPKGKDGQSLGKTFNVFAAPESFKQNSGAALSLKFNEAVRHVAQLKSWHGHDGGNYPDENSFYQALSNGSYQGGWVIPTEEMLVGAVVRAESQERGLYENGNRPDVQAFFAKNSNQGDWYWLNTPHPFSSLFQQVACLSSGYKVWVDRDNNRKQCWPVRLVEVKPGV